MLDTIKEATLRELVQAQSVRVATVLGRPGGYAISVRYGMAERALATSRGGLRLSHWTPPASSCATWVFRASR